MKFLKNIFCVLALSQMHAMTYETYLESWDYKDAGPNNVLSVVTNTPGLSPSISTLQFYQMIFDVAFGNLNFDSSGNPLGYQFTPYGGNTTSNLTYLKGQIQPNGGKLKISFGGATYPIHACSSFPQAGGDTTAFLQTLPSQIAHYVSSIGLDGVDFDIEDTTNPLPSGYTSASFAAILQQFLIAVRQAFNAVNMPNALISATIPAQGWNTYWQTLIQGVTQYEVQNNVNICDYWNFMEYDIWVPSNLTFPQQIIADIQTYTGAIGTTPGPNASPGWGIPAKKIQLGLMPGIDDNGHQLSPNDAAGLISSCISQYGLHGGMMTWDHDRDAGSTGASTPVTGYGPYAFSNALRPVLAATEQSTKPQVMRGPGVYLHRGSGYRFKNNFQQDFVRQPPPPHGAPL